ncbi:spore coat protein [Salipaludibacillus agaradhaerens]|jgi:spore coat protein CotF|uniref:Spore coat protein n=1 Tax=Salipaludibacillus agaradhaerens TaxID=76935 RepID=A0A9Q4AZC7_SALAG|nr:spore coat protein [Salipaludibacillus agaradhaerens]MCR6095202.1 spore coat protein [Salipaludibacillus agaradhaerens]MCR6115240.1 spore coat protein [Salipaludibacillus agaradhaerens]
MNQQQPQAGSQQQSKIQNPKTQVPETPQMNDRDYINDILATEKYMTSSYSTAMNEASHEALYTDIETICTESQRCQRELFNLMFEKGWYSFEASDTQKLDQSYQQYQGYSTQFPY